MVDISAEQKARDMLERMGVEGAQIYTSSDLVELANLISANESIKKQLQDFKNRANEQVDTAGIFYDRLNVVPFILVSRHIAMIENHINTLT